MSKTDLARDVAASPATLSFHFPIAVYLDEALGLSTLAADHWKPVHDGKAIKLPGLSSVAHKKSGGYALSEHTSDEIQTLVKEAREAQTTFRLAQNPRLSREDLEQASHDLSEFLEAALEFLLDDGQDADESKLEALDQAHAHDTTLAQEAQALEDYAALAKLHRKELDGLGDFDVAIIDRAHEDAEKLRARGAARAPSAESTAAMESRNRILNALDVRVRAVRAATRFVFRKHEDIQRRAASGYERRKRAASRRAAAAKAQSKPAS